MGENGAGKTTLINVLNGIVAPESGVIFIGGQQVEEMTPESAQRAGIEIVYQEPMLIDSLSSVRNFFLDHELKKAVGLVPFFDYRGVEQIAAEAIRSFGLTLNRPLRQPGPIPVSA